jgi:hypothetical protein
VLGDLGAVGADVLGAATGVAEADGATAGASAGLITGTDPLDVGVADGAMAVGAATGADIGGAAGGAGGLKQALLETWELLETGQGIAEPGKGNPSESHIGSSCGVYLCTYGHTLSQSRNLESTDNRCKCKYNQPSRCIRCIGRKKSRSWEHSLPRCQP